MKTIADVIKESGRWEYLEKILFKLALTTDYDLPATPYRDGDGEFKNRIIVEGIRISIAFWLKAVEMKIEDIVAFDNEEKGLLVPLESWVNNEIEMISHNYANMISHRKTPSEMDMETLRTLKILHSSIFYIQCPWDPDPNNSDPIEFDIPKGWAVQE